MTDKWPRSGGLWAILAGQAAAVLAGMAAATYGELLLALFLVALAAGLTVAVWRRGGRNFAALEAVPPNMLLIALPTVLASSSVSLVIGVAGCAVIGLAAVAMWPQHPRIALTWACAILPAIALFIVLRPNYPGTIFNGLFVTVGCAVIAIVVMRSASTSAALVSLVDGLGLFSVASMVLWFAGFTGQADRTVGLENSITGGERVIFPLSTSLAATPSMAAVYIVGVVPILIVYPRYRMLRVAALPCAVAILILSDSRVSMVGAAALGASVLLAPRLFRRAAPWIVGAAAALPFVYAYVQAAAAAASTWVPWLIRSDEKAGTLARRDYIWSQSLEFYATRTDWLHQTFGFGSFGHVASGASGYYFVHFEGLGSDARLVTPHNTMLQILFDGGWLMAIVLAGTMIFLARRLSRRPSPIYLAGLAMLVGLSIVSITEVALSPSHAHAQPTWWVLVILGIVVFARDRLPDRGGAASKSIAETSVDLVPTNTLHTSPNAQS